LRNRLVRFGDSNTHRKVVYLLRGSS